MGWFSKPREKSFAPDSWQESKRALYSDYCRTSIFARQGMLGEKEYLEARLHADGRTWAVQKVAITSSAAQGDVAAVKSIKDACFFEALHILATYEHSQGALGWQKSEEAGKDDYRAAAHAEDIVFDLSGLPQLADGGRPPADMDFAASEIAALAEARRSRVQLFLGRPLAPAFQKVAGSEALAEEMAADIYLLGRLNYIRDSLQQAASYCNPAYKSGDPSRYQYFYLHMQGAINAARSGEEILKDSDRKEFLRPLRLGAQMALVMYLAQRSRHETASSLYGDGIKEKILGDYYGASGKGDYYEQRIDWFANEYSTLQEYLAQEAREGTRFAALQEALPGILKNRTPADIGDILRALSLQTEAALQIVRDADQERQQATVQKALPGFTP